MREASAVLQDAIEAYAGLKGYETPKLLSVGSIREHFALISRNYYALAAMSRRKILDEAIRDQAYRTLFPLRTLLENRILESLRALDDPLAVIRDVTRKSFFGKSIKQGVSIRYPLNTCVPTLLCAGRCYAHDGRDRDYQSLFRGVLNGFVGTYYEANQAHRGLIMTALSAEIDAAIAASREESAASALAGYKRQPRIRFSHVGEMAATPSFANDLATEIRRRDPEVSCVIYTRHPEARGLDAAAFVVNFTVEGSGDKRIDFYPKGARLVSSSWDGQLFVGADVNFLEHHVEKSANAAGDGSVCPVTRDHDLMPTCDSARCERCFVPFREAANLPEDLE